MQDKCSKLDICSKVQMVLDKGYDMPELYAVMIREVCKKCEEAFWLGGK